MPPPAEVKDAFEALGERFKWDTKIVKWILAEDGLAATSINDFIFAVDKHDDIVKIVDAAAADNKMLMTSRVKQAWQDLKKSAEDKEGIKRKGMDDPELETLLPQEELEDMCKMHFKRYKMVWPPEVMPSDQAISRATTELTKRMLGMTSVWKVKTQAMQLKATRKRIKLGDIEVVHGEVGEDEEPRHDMAHYLNNLLALLIAYSIPGAQATSEAQAASEVRGCDTCKFVICPLDVLMRYYYKVQTRSHEAHGPAGLHWLVAQDEAERSEWVDKFRNTQMSMGEVIQLTMTQRQAMWAIPQSIQSHQQHQQQRSPQQHRQHQAPRMKVGGKGGKGKGKGTGSGKTGTAQRMENKFKDGKMLCMSYNHGKCQSNPCSKGKHVCAGSLGQGRVCGGPHPAIRCNNPRVIKK